MELSPAIIKAIGAIRTPITVTALIIVVIYLLISQILSLGIFPTIGQSATAIFLESLLSKLFWLAIAGLIFGATLFALPLLLPKTRQGRVHLVSADHNRELSSYDPEAAAKDGNRKGHRK